MRDTFPALVVGIGKNIAWVVLDNESEARLAAIRRSSNKKDAAPRVMPVPGDTAAVRMLEDGSTIIEQLAPRVSSLERRTAGGRSKILAANVDTLVIVVALANPEPRLITLDQLIAFAELETLGLLSETTTAIAPVIVYTKPDLVEESFRLGLEALYSGLGYSVLTVAPKAGGKLDSLISALSGRHALLCGNSGVGKSSIFRALGGEARIGETSRHGLGRQTTTTAHLFRLPPLENETEKSDGFLIDSPGVNEFGLGRVAANELTQGFVEMRTLAPQCRFTDCTHIQEPGCRIRLAVEGGEIATSRYLSYRRMLLEPT